MSRVVRVWSPLGSERVTVEMGDFQLEALTRFLRTGVDEQYPDWPAHFANQLEGKPWFGHLPNDPDGFASGRTPA